MAWWRDAPGPTDRMRPGLVAAAIALDALALVAALDGAHGLAAAAHVASAAGLALGLGRRAMRTPRALVFAMAVFLPFLGTLGWLAVASVRPAANDRPVPAYLRTPVPGPEAARVHAARPPIRRRGDAASARVLAARGRDDPGATALLRRALADRDEDVRLVAHAVLESKQRVAYRRVQDGAGAGDAGPRDARDLRLAAAHWELARTDLADGECLAHALASARRCACAAAARHARCASLELLVGRIELRRGAIDRGEAALMRAVELGLPPAVAAPYLAEAAFLRRRFDRVAQRLAVADAQPALARVRRFWS
jgi:hypothetical protein